MLAFLELVPAKWWAAIVLVVALVAGGFGWSWHEQSVGAAKLQAKIDAANKAADKAQAAVQSNLDTAATATDAPIIEQINAPTPVAPQIDSGCKLTAEQLTAIKDALK